jgi:hypothetical protein
MQRKGIRVNPAFGDNSGLRFSRVRARANKRRGDKILARRKTATLPSGKIVALQVVPYNGRKPDFSQPAQVQPVSITPLILPDRSQARADIWLAGGGFTSWKPVVQIPNRIIDGGKTTQATTKVADSGRVGAAPTIVASGGIP